MLSNCGIGEDSWKSLGLQRGISQSWRKSAVNTHWRDWWLKLKLQYFGHLMRRASLLEKTLMLERVKAGGKGDDTGWDGWMASSTQWAWVWAFPGDGEGREPWCAVVHGAAKNQTRLSDWTTLSKQWSKFPIFLVIVFGFGFAWSFLFELEHIWLIRLSSF